MVRQVSLSVGSGWGAELQGRSDLYAAKGRALQSRHLPEGLHIWERQYQLGAA